jgi:hypothetical protein
MAKKTAAKKRTAPTRPTARKPAGARQAAKQGRKTARKRAGVKTARTTAKGAKAKRKAAPARKAATRRKTAARPKAARRGAGKAKAQKGAQKGAKKTAPKKAAPKKAAAKKKGGTGRERNLAQTPAAGRTVKGRTNPHPTKRSTGTPAGAGSSRLAPGLDRKRRELRELEESLPSAPSTLDMDARMASAARTGAAEMRQARREHTESSPVLTGGDVDASWQDAYAVGDEAPGGDNPTPDQDRVDDIGKALGVTYEDNEELKASDKIAERDKHRWELDPASSEDYRTRDKDVDEE